jgi:hypothetical protein
MATKGTIAEILNICFASSVEPSLVPDTHRYMFSRLASNLPIYLAFSYFKNFPQLNAEESVPTVGLANFTTKKTEVEDLVT